MADAMRTGLVHGTAETIDTCAVRFSDGRAGIAVWADSDEPALLVLSDVPALLSAITDSALEAAGQPPLPLIRQG